MKTIYIQDYENKVIVIITNNYRIVNEWYNEEKVKMKPGSDKKGKW